MQLTADNLIREFGYSYQEMRFDSQADYLATVESELSAVSAKVDLPVLEALGTTAPDIETALALRYPDNAAVQTSVGEKLDALFEMARFKFGLAMMNGLGSGRSLAPEFTMRMNEWRIAANQDLATGLDLLTAVLSDIPNSTVSDGIGHSEAGDLVASW